MGRDRLDSYGTERTPHVRHFIDVSIGLGKVICVPDEHEAAQRDTQLRAAIADPSLAPPPPPPPRLGTGILMPDDAHAGRLAIQARVSYAAHEGLFDDVIGRGWFVLTTQPVALTPAARGILDRLNARPLRVGGVGAVDVDVIDLDGRYGQWFAEIGADTVIVRPDFYVYSAGAAADLDVALRVLDSQLDGASADSTRESAEQDHAAPVAG